MRGSDVRITQQKVNLRAIQANTHKMVKMAADEHMTSRGNERPPFGFFDVVSVVFLFRKS